MLELQKIIRVLHVLAWPIVFILFYKRRWKEGVFKVMINDHFLVFLAVWVLFPKCLSSSRGELC